jgi:hypothetical protein
MSIIQDAFYLGLISLTTACGIETVVEAVRIVAGTDETEADPR